MPNLHIDNKWYAFLIEVTRQKCYVRDANEAIRLIQSNNDNVVIVIRGLIKNFSLKTGFFATVIDCLQQGSKLDLKNMMQTLQKHSLEEADRMQAIKPDILAKFRSSLKYAAIDNQKNGQISEKTTSKFNSTHSKIKS